MTTDLIPYEERVGALSPQDVRAQVNLIQRVMADVMKKDEHYGVIPGTGTKPSLLKAGAEKICLTFRLDPQYQVEQRYDGPHLSITSTCTLWHIPTGQRFGSGMGSCTTRESKYAYRKAQPKCPKCGVEAIMRSKYPPKDDPSANPGWYCYAKKGGCGRQFPADAAAILSQPSGRVPNEDLPDSYNTVLKMANKRSLVAAVLNATAASDIFTQDIEDIPAARAQPEPEEEPQTERLKEVLAEASDTYMPASAEERLRECGSLAALQQVWDSLTPQQRNKALKIILDDCKLAIIESERVAAAER